MSETPFDDKMHEACGVFGIYNHPEAARMTYLGLHQLQHRGQESAGIVSSDLKRFHSHIGMGLVSDVFTQSTLDRLSGPMAIGHVRYGTAGDSTLVNAQPIVVKAARGSLALAHNGNLTNAFVLRKELEKQGSIFQTSADSEVFLHLVARSRQPDLVEAFKDALLQIKGAYSFVISTPDTIYAIRDPHGVRPLHVGSLEGSLVVASETCAFSIIGAELIREIAPGEIISVNKDGIKTVGQLATNGKAHCVFEYVYFARPDSQIFGKSVYDVRKELGRQLAREAPVGADVVVAVPDSASVAAVGYAEQSGVPMAVGLIRSHYVGRTFIEPKQSIRDFGARMKLSPVVEAVKGKRVILIDDSIVRGTTSRKIVRMLRQSGASEIHMRISSPPVKSPCFYGIDTPTSKELVGSTMSVEEIRKFLDADSLAYLSADGMLNSTGRDPKDFCAACFTKNYPIPINFEGVTHSGSHEPN